jgi:Tol biopolymer transport system component
MDRWHAGTIKLSTPQALPNQSSSAPPNNERDPWVSSDGMQLYYAFDPNGTGNKSDVYLATRASTSAPFGQGTRLTNLNTIADEGRVSLTEDGKLLVMSTNKDGGNQFNIDIATRSSTTMEFPSADNRFMDNINTPNTDHFDPFVTRDGLKLYLAPVPAGQKQHILVATRTDATMSFSVATQVPIINSANNVDGDPALSLDERIIVFSSDRPITAGATDTNLWYATRANVTDNFSVPKQIPDVNSAAQDGDPVLSADGCTLYFSSRRAGGADYDLYSASVDP